MMFIFVLFIMKLDNFKIRLIYDCIIRRVLFDIDIFCGIISKNNDKQGSIKYKNYFQSFLQNF